MKRNMKVLKLREENAQNRSVEKGPVRLSSSVTHRDTQWKDGELLRDRGQDGEVT